MSETSNGSNGVFLNNQLVFHENRSKPFWILIFVRRNGLIWKGTQIYLIFELMTSYWMLCFFSDHETQNFEFNVQFLPQNKSNYIQGLMISSCFRSIYLNGMSLKITQFWHLCPRWRHRFLRKSKMLISAVFSNIHNFAKNQYFFTRFFLFVS